LLSLELAPSHPPLLANISKTSTCATETRQDSGDEGDHYRYVTVPSAESKEKHGVRDPMPELTIV
jgi:hypothetical protein